MPPLHARLNHFDFDNIIRLVIRLHGPVKLSAVVITGVNVFQEVGCRNRCMGRIDLGIYRPEARLNRDCYWPRLCGDHQHTGQ